MYCPDGRAYASMDTLRSIMTNLEVSRNCDAERSRRCGVAEECSLSSMKPRHRGPCPFPGPLPDLVMRMSVFHRLSMICS